MQGGECKKGITLFLDLNKLLLIVVCGLTNVLSQPVSIPKDTITMTLPIAEQRFLQNNLQLLASKLHIEQQRAVKMQAEVS